MIGLATGHKAHNYGNRLQAYALQQTIIRRGFSCEILDITPEREDISGKVKEWVKNGSLLSPLYRHVLRKKNQQKYVDSDGNLDGELLRQVDQRENALNDFNRTYLHIHSCRGTRSQLEAQSAQYKAVFCGSDQAWLPYHVNRHLYTLEFCAPSVRRISYAPSFGISQIPHNMKEAYRVFLDKLDFISVREKRGRELVAELTGKEVPIVLDPTLLLEQSFWNHQIDEIAPLSEPYIFCCFLGESTEHRQFVLRLKQETGCKIIDVPHLMKYVRADDGFADESRFDVNPLEFVALIRDATFICTDSFHCAAFSIQFHKCFAMFERYRNEDRNSTNSRVHSLMEMLKLEDRICLTIEDSPAQWMSRTIDYSETDRLLEEYRKQSNQYLDKALEGLK